jgi:UDP-galactopyranose mutase
MHKEYDLLLVGAGPVGCVIAEQAAKILNWKCLIIDKRPHIAGNCYDRIHESGVMIHQYGPHYFRTNHKWLIDYLSQYTKWVHGNYYVKSYCKGQYFPFPINLNTLEQFFGIPLNEESAHALLEKTRDKIENPTNSEEFVLSRVGKAMYESFYLNYTLKQWDKHPKELDKSVCGRIPVRMNRDERYVDHAYQLTPKEGFTQMFQNMISHPNIDVLLETDYNAIKAEIKPRRATVYAGPIDEYFAFSLGKLPWRSLKFDFVTYNQNYFQPCVQINYPNDFDYTRTVEIKHVTRQACNNTVISYEYATSEGDPFYPIPAPENKSLYLKYEKMAIEEEQKNKVYFAGRLAKYIYLNTDEVIEMAFHTFEKIKMDAGS